MIVRNHFNFWVLVSLVVIIRVNCAFSVSSTSSKSKSKFSKASKAAGATSSSRHTSAHQYGSLLLKPSKPDPHFEILDEQRSFSNNNYGTALTEGRAGTQQRKPSNKLNKESRRGASESVSASSTKLSHISSVARSSSSRREKSKPIFPSLSSASVESTFQKKNSPRERTSPGRFLGSQLISGDAGSLTQNIQATHPPQTEKNGWKILMGPSVAPEDEETVVNNDGIVTRRSFTSLTDDLASHHRTITKLKELHRGNNKRKYSSRFTMSHDEIPVTEIEKITRSNALSRTIKDNLGRRSMQVGIPKQTLKHKYATITRRQPSKISAAPTSKPDRMAKKVPMTITNLNLLDNSLQTKPDSKSYYTNDDQPRIMNRLRSSPTMTLDTKKLVIEPLPSSAEPSTFLAGTSMEEGEPTPSASSPLHSRYETVVLPPDNMVVGDGDEDDNDGNINEHAFTQFQTKTAFNPADYSLVSISTSPILNHHPASFHNHHVELGGPVVSSPSTIPQHHLDTIPQFSGTAPPAAAELREEPPPQPVEFAAVAGPASKNVLPPPLLPKPGPLSSSRLPPPAHPPPPNYNGIVGSSSRLRVPPFRRLPLPLPDFRELDQRFEVVPSVELNYHNNLITPGGYPPLPVPMGRHPPPPPHPPHMFHDPLPRPPEPVSSNLHPVVHGPVGHHGLPLGGPHMLPPQYGPPHHALPPPLYPPLDPRHPLTRKPLVPFDVGSARKAGGNKHKIPAPQPPPPGVDPGHPVVQMALRTPHSLLADGFFIEPTESSSNHVPGATKKYLPNIHYKVPDGALIPLDKRLVYLSMIFSWMFWITTFYTYYRYAINGNKTKPFTLNVPHDGAAPLVGAGRRALDANNPWNFAKVLEYIEIAQKTYEGFDWQDLNCQKRTLCELVQKQGEPWGETGRKLANSYVYRVMDALDGIPIPQLIQSYLRHYKEAIQQGKSSGKDCGQVYSQCKFSIKDVLSKAATKKKVA